jgi:hypothetical protein
VDYGGLSILNSSFSFVNFHGRSSISDIILAFKHRPDNFFSVYVVDDQNLSAKRNFSSRFLLGFISYFLRWFAHFLCLLGWHSHGRELYFVLINVEIGFNSIFR